MATTLDKNAARNYLITYTTEGKVNKTKISVARILEKEQTRSDATIKRPESYWFNQTGKAGKVASDDTSVASVDTSFASFDTYVASDDTLVGTDDTFVYTGRNTYMKPDYPSTKIQAQSRGGVFLHPKD